MADDPQKPQNWWQTFPGTLTGLAALITALSGLIIAFHQIQKIPDPPPTPTPSPLPSISTPAPTPTPTSTPTPPSSVNIGGTWHSSTGAEFQIVQSGSTFTFVANDPGTGIWSEGSGTINGQSFTSVFRTSMPSTGTGEGMVSDDGRQMTGTFSDSRIGRYTQTFNR